MEVDSFSFDKRSFPLKWITLSFHKALATRVGKGHRKLLWEVTTPRNQGCKWDTESRINSAEVQRYPGFSLLPPSKQLNFTASPSGKAGRELCSSTKDKQVARKHPQGISCGLYDKGCNLGQSAQVTNKAAKVKTDKQIHQDFYS